MAREDAKPLLHCQHNATGPCCIVLAMQQGFGIFPCVGKWHRDMEFLEEERLWVHEAHRLGVKKSLAGSQLQLWPCPR
jgi:hypothetical protein